MKIEVTDFGCGEALWLRLRGAGRKRSVWAVLPRLEAGILHQLLGEWLEETEGPADSRGDDDADGREGVGHDQPW